jgi:hypothetical protein
MGVKFEVDQEADASATVASVQAPPAPAARPAIRREVPAQRVEDAQASVPAANVVRVTPELVESLKSSEPLIKSLIDELGAQIVKVEPPEPLTTNN